MATATARERIAAFIDQQLFQPVLSDDPQKHPRFRREQVEEARRLTRIEREGILGEVSAGAMLLSFHEAQERSTGNGLEVLLKEIDLPNFSSIRNELDNLAAGLAIIPKPTPGGQIS